MFNTTRFEKLIVRAITILLMLIITLSTLSLAYLFALNTWDALATLVAGFYLLQKVPESKGGSLPDQPGEGGSAGLRPQQGRFRVQNRGGSLAEPSAGWRTKTARHDESGIFLALSRRA